MPSKKIHITISLPWFKSQGADGVGASLESELYRYIQSGEQFPYLPEVLSKALRHALLTPREVKLPDQFILYETAPDTFRVSWRPHPPGKRSLRELRWDIQGGVRRQKPIELVYGPADDPGRIVIPQETQPWGFRAKLLTGEHRSYRWDRVRTWHVLKNPPFPNARLEVFIELPEKRDLRRLRGMHLKVAETFNRTEKPKVQVGTSGYRLAERMVTTWY